MSNMFIPMLLAGCMVLLSSCSNDSSLSSSGEIIDNEVISGLTINVKYAESYDQTQITFSRHWPSTIATDFEKGKVSDNGEIMVDYENANIVVAYDEKGYLTYLKNYIEGDEELNMPESIYNNLRKTMPARDNIRRPMVREEMKDGIVKTFDRDGNVIHELPYDEELYKIPEEELEMYSDWKEQYSTENSIQSSIQNLDKQGINYEVSDEYFAKYSMVSGEDLSEELRFEYVDDLRFGLPVSMVAYKENGNVESVQLSQYSRIKGYPMLTKQVTYQYGEVNGNWEIAYRTVLTRNNIKVTNN